MSDSENLKLYEFFRVVPETAKKTIKGGRINGFTDINPMWRIKKLTEMFGPCGIGWWYVIKDKRLESSPNTPEVSAFVDIDLYYKWNGEVSQPIPGTGGSSFIAKQREGLYMSDECFKMALTDAISVAAKSLGIGADVYWGNDRTKYNRYETESKSIKPAAPIPAAPPEDDMYKPTHRCESCGSPLLPYKDKNGIEISVERHIAQSQKKFGKTLCLSCILFEKSRQEKLKEINNA